ncbi:MAG: helix-turn-helix domain-containing protein [Gloeomargarita sp. SKYB31]|nr:helix-turn-helix domain-containing protein [Gloeomargarita sp. SKYB31]
MERLLTSKDVCALLGISRVTLWRLEREGVIKPIPLPLRHKRYNPDDIHRLLRKQNADGQTSAPKL